MYFMLGNVDSDLSNEPLRREDNESFPVTTKRHYDDASSVAPVITTIIILLRIKGKMTFV